MICLTCWSQAEDSTWWKNMVLDSNLSCRDHRVMDDWIDYLEEGWEGEQQR